MHKPNIFKYATKELSQDAFIFWLLDHANPEYEEVDNKIRGVAYNLLRKFFELEGINFPEKIIKVELVKQYKNIDILCHVNNQYTILIEDKTRTTAHGDQLIRYKEIIQNDFYNNKIIAIFFKTYDQSNYESIENDGYKVLNRIDFLKTLNSVDGVCNEIFNEYLDYLTEIEKSVRAFSTTSINKWNEPALKGLPWEGLFQLFRKELSSGDWGYVPNQNGGFMGYWWAFQENETCWQYLQLEECKLVLKINVLNNKNYGYYRDICYKHFLDKSELEELNFVKPTRFGSGKTMTVLRTDYLVFDNLSNLIDIEETIINLRKYTQFIEKYALKSEDFAQVSQNYHIF